MNNKLFNPVSPPWVQTICMGGSLMMSYFLFQNYPHKPFNYLLQSCGFFFFFFTILCSDWWSVVQLSPSPYLRTEALLISEAGSISSQYRFPRWLSSKESACSAGDLGSIPGTERSPDVGNGTSLQYFCLKNPMDRETWWATAHGVARVRHDLVTKHQQNSRLRPFLWIV